MAIVDQPKQPLRVLERHTGSSIGEQQTELSTAARDVLAERRQQIEVEGFSPEHYCQLVACLVNPITHSE